MTRGLWKCVCSYIDVNDNQKKAFLDENQETLFIYDECTQKMEEVQEYKNPIGWLNDDIDWDQEPVFKRSFWDDLMKYVEENIVELED